MKQIKEDFIKVIQFSQNIPNPNVDDLLNRWHEAKLEWINLFGGLIYEYPEKVKFELDDKVKQRRIDAFVETICYNFNNGSLAQFVSDNCQSFFDNTVSTNSYELYGIKPGMKLIKAFKFFEDNKEILHELQSEASRIIQENKIEGTLCFSVHPLDYLSLSCNAHNWRSCHALDGEYRAGNLSYMVDKSTVICYIKSDDNMTINLFPESVPWNSKKWRVLLYMDEPQRQIFAGRQYPFSSQEAMNMVLNTFIEIVRGKEAKSDCWSPWTEAFNTLPPQTEKPSYFLADYYVPVHWAHLKPIRDLIVRDKYTLEFNDLLQSSSYIPLYSSRACYSKTPIIPIAIGGEVCCLECGQDIITNHETMRCDCCERAYGEDYTVCCSYCGGRHSRDSMVEDVNGDLVCPDCLELFYFQCEKCGEYCVKTDIHFDRENNLRICSCCYEEEEEEE